MPDTKQNYPHYAVFFRLILSMKRYNPNSKSEFRHIVILERYSAQRRKRFAV